MPTENEKKIVLLPNTPEDEFLTQSSCVLHIQQAYLDANGHIIRIRKTKIKNHEKYVFCFKHKVKSNDSYRIVEIEKEIDARDFNQLFPSFNSQLTKTRYHIEHKDGLWEVDFFKDYDKNNYFIMAEHEMPEIQLQPKSIPDIISNYMLHDVKLFDADYGSNRLCDVQHAKNILKTLTNKEKVV
jgi:CYTH domain-containing protein